MPSFDHIEYIVVGGSAGSLDVLKSIVGAIAPTKKLKIAIVIHLPAEGPNLIPEIMQQYTSLTIQEASSGEMMMVDHVYVAPNDYHLSLETNGTVSLSSEELLNYSRPSIDILFESAAYAHGKKTLGILLTGANEDGTKGLQLIKGKNGITIVQNPADAEYPYMPQSAINAQAPDFILSEKEMVMFLNELSRKQL